MTFIEITAVLGNLGEFIGAIAVVVTLFYVGIQVKNSKEATEANTRSLEEGRKIALVNAYQTSSSEACASVRMLAESSISTIMMKYLDSGVAALNPEEKLRLSRFHMNNVYRLDASFFAYQQGLLPEFQPTLEDAIRILGPIWRDLGINIPRASFRNEVDSILAMVDKEAAAETA